MIYNIIRFSLFNYYFFLGFKIFYNRIGFSRDLFTNYKRDKSKNIN